MIEEQATCVPLCMFWLLQVIISRNYRGDIDMGIIDKFMPLLMEREEEGRQSPALDHQDATFIYIKHSNLYCEYYCFTRNWSGNGLNV